MSEYDVLVNKVNQVTRLLTIPDDALEVRKLGKMFSLYDISGKAIQVGLSYSKMYTYLCAFLDGIEFATTTG